MAKKKPEEKPVETAIKPQVKPVRLDLSPEVHKALRRAAADAEMAMAPFARKIIMEYLGFKATD